MHAGRPPYRVHAYSMVDAGTGNGLIHKCQPGSKMPPYLKGTNMEVRRKRGQAWASMGARKTALLSTLRYQIPYCSVMQMQPILTAVDKLILYGALFR